MTDQKKKGSIKEMKKFVGWGIAAAVLAFIVTVLRTVIRTAKNASEFMKPIKN